MCVCVFPGAGGSGGGGGGGGGNAMTRYSCNYSLYRHIYLIITAACYIKSWYLCASFCSCVWTLPKYRMISPKWHVTNTDAGPLPVLGRESGYRTRRCHICVTSVFDVRRPQQPGSVVATANVGGRHEPCHDRLRLLGTYLTVSVCVCVCVCV